MHSDWIQFLMGIAIFGSYLIFSAKTEMGTKLFIGLNRERLNTCLENITDFWLISDRIATSGQPTLAQFRAIADYDYETIINLALPTSDNAIANEAEIVQSLGMEYVAIPLVWENPTGSDLTCFLQAMDKRKKQKVFIHCTKNMQVSVFVYLYRRVSLNIAHEQAITDLHKVWHPNNVLQDFIDIFISALKLED